MESHLRTPPRLTRPLATCVYHFLGHSCAVAPPPQTFSEYTAPTIKVFAPHRSMNPARNHGVGTAAHGRAAATPSPEAAASNPSVQKGRAVMAKVVPDSKPDMIAWYAERVDDWSANAATLGLDMAMITSLATYLENAQNAESSAFTARVESKAASVTYNNEATALREFGAGLVKTIKATAETSGDPNIYALALIPPPAPPSPAGPPEQPTNVTAQLLPGGGLRLTWKGSVAHGAYFSVYRRVAGESAFTLLKSPKDKTYDDTTIPAGTSSLTYFIQAVRDQNTVNSDWYQVTFGVGGATVTTIAMAA